MAKRDYDGEQEVVVKKKGGFLGKFVALLLGFVLGVVGCLGGIIGGGYYLAKKKTAKDIFSLAGIDYSSYLSEEYASKTLWDMFGSTVSTLSAFAGGTATFGDLAAISPMVEDMVAGFADSAKEAYGVDINKDGALMNVPFSELNAHISNCLSETEVAVMLSAFGGGNKVITALCYGVEGEDYVVENGNIQMLDGKKAMTVGEFSGSGLTERLNALPLDTLMTVNVNDKTTCALVYGEEHHYTVNGDGSVTMNQKQYTLVDNAGNPSLLDDHGDTVECAILPISETVYKVTLADESVQYLSKTKYEEPAAPETEDESGDPEAEAQSQAVEETDSNVYYAYADEACSKPVRYKKTTVKELQEDSAGIVNRIALKDALNVTHNSHGILIAIAYGEEGVDFEYTYDSETEEKTGIEPLGALRTIGDLRSNSQAMIDGVSLTSVITPKQDNKIVMYLLYGREGVHYSIGEDGKPDMLQKQVALYNGAVYNEYGEPIANAKSTDNGQTYVQYATDDTTALASYTLTAINGKTIEVTLPLADGETEAQTAQAQLYYVADENGNAVEYESTKMGDLSGDSKLLSNLTSRLTLSDVLDVKDNKILKHLTNVTIAKLPDAVNGLTVGQIFDEDMHYKNLNGVVVKIADSTETKTLTGAEYTDNNGKTVPAGAYVDRYGNLVENKYEALKPMWKYLLRMDVTDLSEEQLEALQTTDGVFYDGAENTTNGRYYNYNYKVTSDMSTMVENIEHNMQDTPMKEMSDDGVIEISSQNHLCEREIDGTIKQNNSDKFGNYNTLGDLTIKQLLDYVDLYIALKG